MKYIITESRLNEFMNEYMNTWASTKKAWKWDNFIIVDSILDEGEDATVMEYDSEDGRLWIINHFRKSLMDLFNKSKIEINEFIKNWFENKFNVKVKIII